MILNARVDQNIYLELGKDLTFEVKNNGATLTLSPLFTNVATDGNIIKALEMGRTAGAGKNGGNDEAADGQRASHPQGSPAAGIPGMACFYGGGRAGRYYQSAQAESSG